MEYHVTVKGFKSGLNELLSGKVYDHRTKKYRNIIKNRNDALCMKFINLSNLKGKRIEKPIIIHYRFYVENKMHDRMNTASAFIKSFEDAAGLSFEGGTGISVSNAVEAWNEKNPDKAINITYSDADTSVFLQHVADGSQDFTIIDLAMYNSYMEEFNYDVQKNDIPEDEAKMIAENSYAYYIFPQDQKDLREQVDKALKELKEDGTLTEISKKWYGQDAAPEDDKFEETIN